MLQRYDDGGFTGASLDRPALQQLLAAIEAGQVDCVVVYKVFSLERISIHRSCSGDKQVEIEVPLWLLPSCFSPLRDYLSAHRSLPAH